MILRSIIGASYLIRINSSVSIRRAITRMLQERYTSTAPSETATQSNPTLTGPKKTVNKAMKAYLERAQQYQEFMEQQTQEYKIGKRHLANMMGEDPETFTQQNIDDALEYLFPSGLYDKRARPFMKPPEEVFPVQKAAEFDETGRPYHFLFYTLKPNFYKLLYDIVEKINESYKFEDTMIRKNLEPDAALEMVFTGYKWMDKERLEKQLVETISEVDYRNFVASMERLCKIPFSYRYKDFIMSYSVSLLSRVTTQDIPKLQYEADGRAFITVYECLRKRARGHVTIRSPGVGLVSINDKDLTYFDDMQPREQASKLHGIIQKYDHVSFHWLKGLKININHLSGINTTVTQAPSAN